MSVSDLTLVHCGGWAWLLRFTSSACSLLEDEFSSASTIQSIGSLVCRILLELIETVLIITEPVDCQSKGVLAAIDIFKEISPAVIDIPLTSSEIPLRLYAFLVLSFHLASMFDLISNY